MSEAERAEAADMTATILSMASVCRGTLTPEEIGLMIDSIPANATVDDIGKHFASALIWKLSGVSN